MAFERETQLQVHNMKKHDSYKKKCKLCGEKFKMEQDLQIHERRGCPGKKGTTPDTFCDENPPGKFYCHRYRHKFNV